MTSSHDHHHPPPLRRLLSLLRPEKREIYTVILYAVGVGVLSLATPIAALAVVNTTAMATLVQQLLVLCLALFGSLALASFLRALQTIVVEYLQQRIFVRVAGELAHRLPRVDIRAYDQNHGPELVNRFFDVLTVQKAAASLLLDGISVVLQMAIGLTLLAAYHQYLLGFDLLLLASLGLIVFVLGRGAVASSIRESISKYEVAGWMEEMARHPGAFKLNGAPRFALARADWLTKNYLEHRQSHFRILMRQFSFALALQAIANTSLLGLGGYLVINGQLTLGQLVAAEIVVTLVVASFTKLGKHLETYYDLLAAVDKLGHLLDLPLEKPDGVPFRPAGRGLAVRIHQVAFQYENGERPVLHELNLNVAAGERVAVVGPNGAGKSTLVDLLVGLRLPTAGYIEMDGQDLRDLSLDSLRQHVAVAKGLEIFEGTVLDNVRMGRDDLGLDDVKAALAQVDLLDDVLELPEGLHAPLRTGGGPLSFGQAERLMLARALVGKPRLFILDELLDDMDARVRETVLPMLLHPEAPWTLLVITHDPDVAERCGRQVQFERPRERHLRVG